MDIASLLDLYHPDWSTLCILASICSSLTSHQSGHFSYLVWPCVSSVVSNRVTLSLGFFKTRMAFSPFLNNNVGQKWIRVGRGGKQMHAHEDQGCRPAQHPSRKPCGRHSAATSRVGDKETQGVRTHLNEGELLFTGVVVARGSLVLLGRAWAVLVAELVCGVNQLPGVLGREQRPRVHQWVNRSTKPGESTQWSSTQWRKEMKYLSVQQWTDLNNMQLKPDTNNCVWYDSIHKKHPQNREI